MAERSHARAHARLDGQRILMPGSLAGRMAFRYHRFWRDDSANITFGRRTYGGMGPGHTCCAHAGPQTRTRFDPAGRVAENSSANADGSHLRVPQQLLDQPAPLSLSPVAHATRRGGLRLQPRSQRRHKDSQRRDKARIAGVRDPTTERLGPRPRLLRAGNGRPRSAG